MIGSKRQKQESVKDEEDEDMRMEEKDEAMRWVNHLQAERAPGGAAAAGQPLRVTPKKNRHALLPKKTKKKEVLKC